MKQNKHLLWEIREYRLGAVSEKCHLRFKPGFKVFIFRVLSIWQTTSVRYLSHLHICHVYHYYFPIWTCIVFLIIIRWKNKINQLYLKTVEHIKIMHISQGFTIKRLAALYSLEKTNDNFLQSMHNCLMVILIQSGPVNLGNFYFVALLKCHYNCWFYFWNINTYNQPQGNHHVADKRSNWTRKKQYDVVQRQSDFWHCFDIEYW